MSDRIAVTNSGDGQFEIRKVENGELTKYRTDSESDIIRYTVEGHITDYDAHEHVKSDVADAGGGWTRVSITYSMSLEQDTWMDIGTDFELAFGKGGKGWYDTCEEGGDRNDREVVVWWIVKHNHGPWICRLDTDPKPFGSIDYGKEGRVFLGLQQFSVFQHDRIEHPGTTHTKLYRELI